MDTAQQLTLGDPRPLFSGGSEVTVVCLSLRVEYGQYSNSTDGRTTRLLSGHEPSLMNSFSLAANPMHAKAPWYNYPTLPARINVEPVIFWQSFHHAGRHIQ